MYALVLKGKTSPKLLTSHSITSNLKNRYNLGYDSEPERTLLRRRREARRARQVTLEQQLNMAAEHQDDNMNMDNQNRITLGQYINPTAESCGSTIRRPTIQANNFELKPSLIQLV
ncbi:hypothetical protein PIB30_022481 [Stylosanthes scabra]|uniref:Uncharacterized protein n=1 Tax=Stylosanthes scabra TaxID=79078 RepID=A0ABU6T922_9FABA|nr:hypothetical protein [Stylosanthes scabra]